MQVIKRNGNKIDFNPNKILTRIKKQSEGLKVNADEVFIKVTQGLADDMSTNELDDLISVVSESLAMNHPDYSKLAANIAITKLHKETEDSFMKATKKQYNCFPMQTTKTLRWVAKYHNPWRDYSGSTNGRHERHTNPKTSGRNANFVCLPNR